jgi:hypothetical protein
MDSIDGRHEQSFIDQIVAGEETGHYFLLIGEKVSRSRFVLTIGDWEENFVIRVSMVIIRADRSAMGRINGEGCSMMGMSRSDKADRTRCP